MLKAKDVLEIEKNKKEKLLQEAQRQRDIDDGKLIPENPVTLKEIEAKIKITAERGDCRWVTYDGTLKPSIIKSLKKNGFLLAQITNKQTLGVQSSKTREYYVRIPVGFLKWEKVRRIEPLWEVRDFYNTYTLIYWGDEIPAALTIEHEKVIEL